jgi:hypothetical protein
MSNKFQVLFNDIMENVAAGNMSSGVFGTPQQAVYGPPSNIDSADTYAPNDARNLFGAYDTKKRERKPSNAKKPGKKIGKKHPTTASTKKMFPKVIRRNFPETFLGA